MNLSCYEFYVAEANEDAVSDLPGRVSRRSLESWRCEAATGLSTTQVRGARGIGNLHRLDVGDARFYWLAQGDPQNACCGGNACSAGDGAVRGTLGRNAAPGEATGKVEELSTCLALIEIVNSCNLACPTCFADSPRDPHVDAVPLAELQARIQGVIDRKGGIEILQLSGGEPTLHPQFAELLAWCHGNPGIDYVLLNTNGVRLAQDDAFLDELAKTFRYGKFQLYLQFDGPGEAGQRALRGADLREIRRRAIERCGTLNIPITLAMTVTAENLAQVWEAVTFGLTYPHIRGVAFQPMFATGRAPSISARLNTADIILAAVEQAGGRLRFEDFTPLPCGDPNCATIGYLLRTPDGGRARSANLSISRRCRDFCATRSATAWKTCSSAAVRTNHWARCSRNSNWMSDTRFDFSSSPSWTPGHGTRTASIAAVRM